MRPFLNMATSFSKSPHLLQAAIAIASCGIVLSACNGPTSSFVVPGASAQGSQAARHTSATPTPSPIPFNYVTVDNPDSNANEVTAINQLGKIVGEYGGGSGSNIPQSYTSEPNYTKFRNENEPDSQGTFATSMSSNRLMAGFVVDPNGYGGTEGFVKRKGQWTLLADPSVGTGGNEVTKILGINDSENAVGFYLNPSGTEVPFEANVSQKAFINLTPPGAVGNAEATGINGKGDIVGWEKSSKGIIGWYLQAGTYYPFSYSGGTSTYALSVGWSDQVAGYYTDSNGGMHGFILTGPSKGGAEQVWQTIDEPNAVYGTVVTGINTHHHICGYYYDKSDVQHGFVATPKS
jgi:hypothetical protein